jgi:type II secretory pathway pseudopilin PulG
MKNKSTTTERNQKNTTTFKELLLIGLIFVMIWGILAAIALPRIGQPNGKAFNARVNACKENVEIINSQIELYYSRTGSWPLNAEQVINDPDYFPDGPPICPFGPDKKPYILTTTNGKSRILEHLHSSKK